MSAPINEHPAASLQARRFSGLTLTGEIGARYRIEATSDVGVSTPTWLPITEVVLSGSPLHWIDPISDTEQRRFYRSVAIP